MANWKDAYTLKLSPGESVGEGKTVNRLCCCLNSGARYR